MTPNFFLCVAVHVHLCENCFHNDFLYMFYRIFIYTHRRMAITADDVSLEGIIPISLDFAVVEGELFVVHHNS